MRDRVGVFMAGGGWRLAVALLAGAAVSGCETTDPATREPKVSEAASQGAEGALVGAVLCGGSSLLQGNSGETVAKHAATCAALGGAAGVVSGAIEDERDLELLEEFTRAGLIVKVRDANLVLESSSRINFEWDSANPDRSSARLLRSVARIINRFPHRAIDVIGHNSDDEDESLGAARARAVASILARNGVRSGRIWSAGRGSSEPIVSDGGSLSGYRNRRVEIFFVLAS